MMPMSTVRTITLFWGSTLAWASSVSGAPWKKPEEPLNATACDAFSAEAMAGAVVAAGLGIAVGAFGVSAPSLPKSSLEDSSTLIPVVALSSELSSWVT
jgi:hypothetical protein